jgi:hypothetical protein
VCYLSYEYFILWIIKGLKMYQHLQTDEAITHEGATLPAVSDPEYDSDPEMHTCGRYCYG